MKRKHDEETEWALSWPAEAEDSFDDSLRDEVVKDADGDVRVWANAGNCWEALEEMRLAQGAKDKRRGVEKARKTRARNKTKKAQALRIWRAWAIKHGGYTP